MIYLDADFVLRQWSIVGYVTEDEGKRCAPKHKGYTKPTSMIVTDNFDYLLITCNDNVSSSSNTVNRFRDDMPLAQSGYDNMLASNLDT